MANLIDMTGWVMKEHGVPNSMLTVIERVPNKKPATWLCKCECGNYTKVDGCNLRTGHTTSCGCKRAQIDLDITGWIMKEHGVENSRLTVIERVAKPTHVKTRGAYFLCQCECGNTTIVHQSSIMSGTTLSCGCLHSERSRENMINNIAPIWKETHKDGIPKNNLTGQRFGKLVVLNFSHKDKNGNMIYKCQCDCGNITYSHYSGLVTGATQGCGCTKSRGESRLGSILTNLPYIVIKEQTFSDLYDKLPLRFDFALYNNDKLVCLIEYQGIQHTDINNPYHTDTLVLHDNMKKEYCQTHKIPLIEIPYTDYDKLDEQYMLDKLSNL